jgi:nucleotide-binding universal stress UspA family protein
MDPVMLATDGSPAAADATKTAIELASALGAPLLIVTCWDVAYTGAVLGFGPIVPDLDHISQEKAEQVADEAAEGARAAGVAAMTYVRRGDPASQICRIAAERDARLIVIGSHGWGALRRLVFGSVSTGVLHHARNPVLVVPTRPVKVGDNGRVHSVETGGGR